METQELNQKRPVNTTIYYFSGTGNSLYAAKQLAGKLECCELQSIAHVMEQESVSTNAGRVGFVFPVYAWGAPRIVMDFLNKISLAPNCYVFAVATCYGIAAKTLIEVQSALRKRNRELDAGFVVKSGCASLMKMNALDKVIIKLDQRNIKKLKSCDERLEEMVSIIKNFKKHRPETSTAAANMFGSLFHSYGINTFKTIDQQFTVNDECNACGTCVKVCPRNNIRIVNHKPEFYQDCEFCHACIQWCPKFAIRHPGFNPECPQYQHPEVKLKEMMVTA